MKGEAHTRAQQALRGKHVLLTGATGFLGKVILEKLLRAVPDIGGIHLLIRGNRQHGDARERFFADVADSSVFDRLRSEDPRWLKERLRQRVHCVTGEVTAPRFGLPEGVFTALADRVDAVVHAAASVNFREAMDKALSINTLCLDNLVALSRTGGGLPIIQVSTCYVNGFHRGSIGEDTLPPSRTDLPDDGNGVYDTSALVTRLGRQIEAIDRRYAGREHRDRMVELGVRESRRHGWNDSYTFTKWLGEQRLLRAAGEHRLPLTILRPSIIESTLQEPAPGWIEGVKVADAILLAYARQKVTFFPCRRSGLLDIIPADLVANAAILSLAEQLVRPVGPRVYQCCSGSTNPVRVGQLIDHIMCEARENHASYDRLFLQPPRRRLVPVDKRLFHTAMATLRAPLAATEKTLRLLGSDADFRTLRNIELAVRLSSIYAFYASPACRFHNERLMALADRLGDADKSLFPVDAGLIDWERYLRKVHMAGVNRYALARRDKPRDPSRTKTYQTA